MDEFSFKLLGGYDNGTDGSKRSNISHKNATSYGNTLDQVIGDNPADNLTHGSVDMVNNAIDHVANTFGYNTSELTGGKVSSSYAAAYNYGNDIKTINIFSNNGRANIRAIAITDPKIPQVTFQLHNLTGDGTRFGIGLTVENIESIMWHEFGGHYKNKVGGDETTTTMTDHRDLINSQMNRPSFNKTTPGFQKSMLKVRNGYNRILESLLGKASSNTKS